MRLKRVTAARLRDGSRKTTYVTEVIGLEGDGVTLHAGSLPHGKD